MTKENHGCIVLHHSIGPNTKQNTRDDQDDNKEVMKWADMLKGPKPPNNQNRLGPAKTYILRGTARTYAIKTRAVTDN